MTKPEYLGNYPRERENGWSQELQGVSHDKENWYFTQIDRIWKFPVTHDLRLKVNGPDPSEGIFSSVIPLVLREAGYDHLGDPTAAFGHLLIPIYEKADWRWQPPSGPWQRVEADSDPAILVLACNDLSYTHHLEIPGVPGIGWLAVDKFRNLVITSKSEITPDDPALVFRFDRQLLQTTGKLEIVHDADLVLQDEDGQDLRLDHMQGGTVGGDGLLYLINGYHKGSTEGTGIHVFPQNGGRRIWHSSRTDNPFKYEYHPGYFKYEEPEGITWWDLDKDRSAPNIRGQLHAILLDNDAGTDDMFLKHYRVEYQGDPDLVPVETATTHAGRDAK